MRTRIVMIIISAALIALPTMAQDWQSTSSMQTSGSAYTPQVTAVGATDVSSMATTTESYNPAKAPGRPRRSDSSDPWGHNQDGGETGDEGSPLGSVWALLVFAAVGGAVVLRRRKGQTE